MSEKTETQTAAVWRIGSDCAGECSDSGSEHCRCYRSGKLETASDKTEAKPVFCDCERGHNGFGMVGRECDCQPVERPWCAWCGGTCKCEGKHK
jgi:hypothetical protein